MLSKSQAVLFCIFLSIAWMMVGFIIGYTTKPSSAGSMVTKDESVVTKLVNEISSENIDRNLK